MSASQWETASLHEQTVQSAESHAATWTRRQRRPRGPARNSPVRTLRVNRDVMRAALKAAGGDASRIRIVDERTVYVR